MTIDWWTLGLQTVNAVILIWLLGRFFWRPVSAMIETRRAQAADILTEAETKRTAAAAALLEIETTRAGYAAEREAILAAAKATAEQARTARLAEAAREADALRETAMAAVAKEREAAASAWSESAIRLGVAIAERLAARLGSPAVHSVFLDWLIKAIEALPERAASDGTGFTVVSATSLDAPEQDRCRIAIGAAIGGDPEIAFETDPALIAGLELRGPTLSVSNSWRADLDRILVDLTHDKPT